MIQADRSDAFSELMVVRAMPAPKAGEVTVTGSDPFYRTPFRVGETAAAVLAATGVAANDLWELRTNRRQTVSVAVPEAAATLRVVDYTRKREADGQYRRPPVSDSMKHMATVTQPWPTADGRWFLPHFNLPHLERRVLDVLGCESTPASVSAAVARWNADALETAIAEARACGGMVRTREEWLAHPQGAYLANRPVVEVTKVAEGLPEPLPPGNRPLSEVRVLDLTRILAGPTAGRTLAEHGADVLMVTAPHLPQVPEYVRDLSHGKRSCFLDLRQADQASRLAVLTREADVFVNGYRPGQLGQHGFGVEELSSLRPGLITVSVSCFGSGGPFATRTGWEQVAQSVSGIAHTHGQMTGAGRPKLAPAPICDYLTGYLAAFGTMLALGRRAREGGSYHVQASLCQSAMFYQRQGLVDGFEDAPEQLTGTELEPLCVREDSSYGDLLTLGPVLRLSETPCRWALPTPKLGADQPEWLAREAGLG
ncbi:CoA transferase [Belnapia sp. T18]|uniref:CoA transferase n=1 Tax=Belnapia arida TaxID=2804533 RepID=A0ABS1U4M4_9PROT|nr:CoA transferase [Belnapia arida]MBL6079639.1 CoA transferase [Belnapia arida]